MKTLLNPNKQYQAQLKLSGVEIFATNTMVAEKLKHAGFADVQVSGTGSQRIALGTWPHSAYEGEVPAQVVEIKELP